MKSYVVSLLIILNTAIFAFGNIRFSYDEQWNAEIAIDDLNSERELFILMIIDESDTNSVMFFADNDPVEVPLTVLDGDYTYMVKDDLGNELLRGSVSLLSPFSIELQWVSATNAGYEITTESDSLFVECYIYEQDEIVSYNRLLVSSNTTFVFNYLETGTDYQAVFTANGFTKEDDFTTPLKNVAYNKPATGTFNRLPESEFVDDSTPAVTRINDGKIEWYSGMAVSGEVNYEEQYVIINLLENVKLKKIITYWNANYYPYDYQFMYSTNGSDWNSIDRSHIEYMNEIADDNSPMAVDTIETNITAKYVGLFIEQGQEIYSRYIYRNYVQLMELETYE